MTTHYTMVAILCAQLMIGAPIGQTPSGQSGPASDAKAKKPGRGGIAGTPGKEMEAKKEGASQSKTLSATGTVAAIDQSSITVKVKNDEITFAVDNKTRIVGKGAGHKSAEKKEANTPTQIADFVKVGDAVMVRYQDMGTTKHAAQITVSRSGPSEHKK